MKRIRGFEWEDQPWFPSFIRQYMMDFLGFVLEAGNLYKPVTPLLLTGLQQTHSHIIIDLCSGSGGAVRSIQKNIQNETGKIISFLVTDLYPNLSAYEQLKKDSNGKISYFSQPVDAVQVPSSMPGFRTIFSGFHHFDDTTAQRVLQNAVAANEGIAVFDGGSRSIWFILIILIFHPIAFLLFTPFIKPFSLQRLLFTYLLPLIPLCAIWDGIVSVLRLYAPDELLLLARKAGADDGYTWQSGIVKNQFGIKIAYLVGYPVASATQY